MDFEPQDVLDSATVGASPSGHRVEDITATGRTRQRRSRYSWIIGGVAAAAAVVAAVSVPHFASAASHQNAQAGAGGTGAGGSGNSSAADVKPLTFPALTSPFMYSVKGYGVGTLHVSDPLFATATYQESMITMDGVAKAKSMNSAGTWVREYDRSVGTLTVYRPGVFKPDKFQSGTKVTVRGLPGLQTTFDAQEPDGGPAKGADGKRAMPSFHTVKVAALAWQYADGAWATITTTILFKTADPAKDVLSLATGLAPADTATSVKVPYKIAVPAGYKLVAIGKFDPLSGGEDISEAYFSKTDIPVTSLTDRLTDQQLMAAKGGTLKIIVTETAPAAPSDPYPHPNPKSPCQPGFCDRAINANYFAEILEGKDNTAVIHSVTNGLVFDNPADPSTWHDVTTSGAAK